MELSLGVYSDGDEEQIPGFFSICDTGDLQSSMTEMASNEDLSFEVQAAIESALEILIDLAVEIGFPLQFDPVNRDPLVVK